MHYFNWGTSMVTTKKNILVSALFIGMVSLGSMAQAADTKAPGSGPNPYSDCGIGAALFSETSWAAVTSNVTWDLGTTAVTSATASPETCSGKNVKTALFIRDTYQQLVEEAAKGEGTHLTAALNLMECGSAKQSMAIQAVRADMSRVVAQPTYQGQTNIEKSAEFFNVINNAVASSCSI